VPELLKPAEFAAIKGVSKPTVHEAMKARIAGAIVEVDGRRLLDRDLALELWDRNTRRNNNTKTGLPADRKAAERKVRQAKAEPPPPATLPTDEQLLALVQGLPEDQVPDLIDSQRRKEHYLAERAKVAALREREEVGSIREMEREAFALAKSVREGMLSIIPRISADLAALGDAFEVEQLLEAEMITALRVLADG
jgi:hypothetical protein